MIYPMKLRFYAPVVTIPFRAFRGHLHYEKFTDGNRKITIHVCRCAPVLLTRVMADARCDDNIGAIIPTGAGDKVPALPSPSFLDFHHAAARRRSAAVTQVCGDTAAKDPASPERAGLQRRIRVFVKPSKRDGGPSAHVLGT